MPGRAGLRPARLASLARPARRVVERVDRQRQAGVGQVDADLVRLAGLGEDAQQGQVGPAEALLDLPERPRGPAAVRHDRHALRGRWGGGRAGRRSPLRRSKAGRTPGRGTASRSCCSGTGATGGAGRRCSWRTAARRWCPCRAGGRRGARGSAAPEAGRPSCAPSRSRTLSSSPRPGMVARPAGLATATQSGVSRRISRGDLANEVLRNEGSVVASVDFCHRMPQAASQTVVPDWPVLLIGWRTRRESQAAKRSRQSCVSRHPAPSCHTAGPAFVTTVIPLTPRPRRPPPALSVDPHFLAFYYDPRQSGGACFRRVPTILNVRGLTFAWR